MTIYFAFSDENGAYRRLRGRKFIRAHPYYVRATVIIDALEWKKLESGYCDLKRKYDIPDEKEVKWSFARSIHAFKNKGKEIREKEAFYFLRAFESEQLLEFLFESVHLLRTLDYCKVIFTVTCNRRCPSIAMERLLKMHLQEVMQRIEMDMQNDNSNLCVFFVDPVSNENDKNLREAYSDLYRNGDFISRYAHIKDSLNIEHSHHSVGIQMADFLAGSFVANLKGYDSGQRFYKEIVIGLIRKSASGVLPGYGFREVPGNKELRSEILDACS